MVKHLLLEVIHLSRHLHDESAPIASDDTVELFSNWRDHWTMVLHSHFDATSYLLPYIMLQLFQTETMAYFVSSCW